MGTGLVNPVRCAGISPPGLTPLGERHGHQTWLDDLHVRYALQADRRGHEVRVSIQAHLFTGDREAEASPAPANPDHDHGAG